MNSTKQPDPVRIGVLTDEPIRLAGLASIFDDRSGENDAPLAPFFGNIEELLADSSLAYLIVDLNSPSAGVESIESIRRKRPDMRLIVIGPEEDDNLVMDLIVAGARAYLNLKAGPRMVRQAVEVVTSGSIWAPRRLLSKLIDRLLGTAQTSPQNAAPHLTHRERQVLDLILQARSNREIARELGIEERTVHGHVGRLLRKTGAENRINLLMRASNPALLHAAGFVERRRADRRQGDRRQGPIFPSERIV